MESSKIPKDTEEDKIRKRCLALYGDGDRSIKEITKIINTEFYTDFTSKDVEEICYSALGYALRNSDTAKKVYRAEIKALRHRFDDAERLLDRFMKLINDYLDKIPEVAESDIEAVVKAIKVIPTGIMVIKEYQSQIGFLKEWLKEIEEKVDKGTLSPLELSNEIQNIMKKLVEDGIITVNSPLYWEQIKKSKKKLIVEEEQN